MTQPRRRIRVSHLTSALVFKRMRKGPFTPRELVEVSGLAIPTIAEMLDTFEHQGLITFIGKTERPGPTGRRERLFREVL